MKLYELFKMLTDLDCPKETEVVVTGYNSYLAVDGTIEKVEVVREPKTCNMGHTHETTKVFIRTDLSTR
jgi:hypothetical protein